MPTKTLKVWVTRDNESDDVLLWPTTKPRWTGRRGYVNAQLDYIKTTALDRWPSLVPNRRGCWPATLTVEIDD